MANTEEPLLYNFDAAGDEEDCTDCGPGEAPEDAGAIGGLSAEEEKAETQSLAVAIITMLISIPALVGACCWPLLLAGLIGIAASEAAVAFAHTFTFAITFALMTNILQYAIHKCSKKKGTHFQKYAPAYVIALAVPFVMADLTRHVCVDAGVWKAGSKPGDKSGALPYKADFEHQCCGFGSDQSCTKDGPFSYTNGTNFCHAAAPKGFGHPNWNCDPDMKICFCGQGMSCLNGLGITFVAVFTYTGFTLLMVGIFWTVDLWPKLKKKWNAVKAAHARAQK